LTEIRGEVSKSTPSLSEFDPQAIPWQFELIRDIRSRFSYSLGFHDILLSGTVGSAKSMVGVHVGLTHCLLYPGARLALARRSMPDLKDTVFNKVLEHIGDDLMEGKDYWVNSSRAQIKFRNGSSIISRSWGDRQAKKARSLDLSALLIEEVTENDEEDKEAIDELKMRIGRCAGVPEAWCIGMTNPDSPSHWAYKEYFNSKNPLKHVYLSNLDQNPFLPSWYKSNLLANLDPKMARRMVGGEWIEIQGEVVYYEYLKDQNFRDAEYKINPNVPIRVSFDFNIGDGKPLSAIFFQKVGDEFHFFDESVIHSARTVETCEDAAARGLFNHDTVYLVHGDATGKARSTQSKQSNYEIISEFLANHRRPDGRPVHYKMQVLKSNPPIRDRHKRMNSYFKNALGITRAWVYRNCKVADEGFRLTKLKKGGQYIEDDSKAFQHITTAAGYGLMTSLLFEDSKPQGTEEL
jgi:hypothetical protein